MPSQVKGEGFDARGPFVVRGTFHSWPAISPASGGSGGSGDGATAGSSGLSALREAPPTPELQPPPRLNLTFRYTSRHHWHAPGNTAAAGLHAPFDRGSGGRQQPGSDLSARPFAKVSLCPAELLCLLSTTTTVSASSAAESEGAMNTNGANGAGVAEDSTPKDAASLAPESSSSSSARNGHGVKPSPYAPAPAAVAAAADAAAKAAAAVAAGSLPHGPGSSSGLLVEVPWVQPSKANKVSAAKGSSSAICAAAAEATSTSGSSNSLLVLKPFHQIPDAVRDFHNTVRVWRKIELKFPNKVRPPRLVPAKNGALNDANKLASASASSSLRAADKSAHDEANDGLKKQEGVGFNNRSNDDDEEDEDDEYDDDGQGDRADDFAGTVLSVTVPCWPQGLDASPPQSFLLRKPLLSAPWIKRQSSSSSTSTSSALEAKQGAVSAGDGGARVEGFALTELPARPGSEVALRATCATHLRFWCPNHDLDDGARAGAPRVVPELLPLCSVAVPTPSTGDLWALPRASTSSSPSSGTVSPVPGRGLQPTDDAGSSSSSSQSGAADDSKAMAQLVDMGFDASSAQVALAAAHGDVGAAAASLSDPSAAPPTSSSHNSLNSGGNGASDDAPAEAAAPRTYLAASSAWAAVFPLKPYEAASEGRENAPGDFDEATGNGVHSNTTTSLLPSTHDAITCQVRAIRIASLVFAFFTPP